MILWYREHQGSTDFNRFQQASTGLLYFEQLGSAAFSVAWRKMRYQVRDQEAGGSNPLAPTT
jgi:hypothetical protein